MEIKAKLIIASVSALMLPSIIVAKDPTAMTIDGKDIKLSEFKYLYNKNKQQQIEPQTFDEYINMFVTYKLKVAEAEAAGIDTTKSFRREFNGYCEELAKPYLEDAACKNQLEQEAYSWMKEDVDVSHVMLPLVDPETGSREKAKELADSVWRMLAVNGDSFNVVALKYSVDPAKNQNAGRLGFIPAGVLPYTFEKAAHETEVGKYSNVVETPFGWHILYINNKRPAKEVLVQHILKFTPRGGSREVVQEVKNIADSIYNVVTGNNKDFSEIARLESDDTGSKTDGGTLPWFGSGQMVPQFEQASFDLAVGEISQPIQTQFGFHIIKKIDERGIKSFEEALPNIRASIENDDRARMPQQIKLEELKKYFKFKEYADVRNSLYDNLNDNGVIDSTFIANMKSNTNLLADYSGGEVRVCDVAPKLKVNTGISKVDAMNYLDRTINGVYEKAIVGVEIKRLISVEPDYRNIVNEYRDGLLLFDISNKNVWDKGNQDIDGLTEYFANNKEKYTWEKPKFKGYLIQVSSDSVATMVKDRLATLEADSLVAKLRSEFKKNIKVERVLVAQGDNRLVDAAFFNNDPTITNTNERFPVYFTHDGSLLNQPEELADVKGQVVVDYQNHLEKQWVENLKSKHKVKLNKKVLQKAID